MILRRGDVVLTYFPFASGSGGKRRPALVVGSDRDNRRLTNAIVAQITTTAGRATEPTHFLIEAATPEGQASGLLHDSVVSCNNLATVAEDRFNKVIGRLPPSSMSRIDDCLKAALDLP